MSPDVTISEELKEQLAKCKPGQSKSMNVMVAMGKDGKVSLSSSATSDEAYEEKAEEKPAPKKKVSSRPKPVMDALKSMY